MSPDTTALAILATVLSGVGGAGLWLLRSLLTDVLATNHALRDTLARMGQRFRDHLDDDRLTADMVEDIHREVVGPKRTSDYGEARRAIRERKVSGD